jgi:hypothetical protein
MELCASVGRYIRLFRDLLNSFQNGQSMLLFHPNPHLPLRVRKLWRT